VSQKTWNETASLNLKSGPPFRAVNVWPFGTNSTVMTDPGFLPWTSCPASLYRVTATIFEFGKTAV
jgi:hypothetical protein